MSRRPVNHLGPTEVKLARALARCRDRGDAHRFHWTTADQIVSIARVPRYRVVHYLEALAGRDLIDRHDDDGRVTYRMRAAFAATLARAEAA